MGTRRTAAFSVPPNTRHTTHTHTHTTQVRVLGEGYTPEDEEDSAVAEITNVWVYQVRRIQTFRVLKLPCCKLPLCCKALAASGLAWSLVTVAKKDR